MSLGRWASRGKSWEKSFASIGFCNSLLYYSSVSEYVRSSSSCLFLSLSGTPCAKLCKVKLVSSAYWGLALVFFLLKSL